MATEDALTHGKRENPDRDALAAQTEVALTQVKLGKHVARVGEGASNEKNGAKHVLWLLRARSPPPNWGEKCERGQIG